MNKRAIELSMNFMVILIVSLVVFGMGLTFFYKIKDESNKILNMKFEELNQKVEELLCQTSDKTCMGITQLTIKKGDFDFFNLKVVNVLDINTNFKIKVEVPEPMGYKKDKSKISITNIPPDTPLQYVPNTEQTFPLDPNKGKKVGIAVGVPKNAISGTYIFNVIVTYQDGASWQDYDKHQLLVKVK